MKLKPIIVIFFSLIALTGYARKNAADSAIVKSTPVYRIEAGYSQSMLTGTKSSMNPYYTVRLGGNVEFPLKYNFGIETGLNYNFSVGKKSQYYTMPRDTAKYAYTNHTLNIPVRATYTLPVSRVFQFFGYAGPNFSIGLAEPTTLKTNTTYWLTGGSYDAYADKLSRFNVQLGAGGGVQWKSFRVKGGYDWGIINVSRNKNTPQYNRGWSVAFEYEF